MYAGDAGPIGDEHIGVRIADCAVDIIEIAAYRRRAATLAALAAQRAVRLPALGHVDRAAARLVLAVRPERWLLLSASAEPGSLARSWEQSCSACAAVIDQSAALHAFQLTGDATREMLKRGCRLDLDPRRFPEGSAAATIIAQVPAILASLPEGILLLASSSTARHVREWLMAAATPFGLGSLANASVALLSGESIS